MKLNLALALAGFAALPSLASAQESFSLMDEPRELRSLSPFQEQGGQVGEVWIAPRTRFAASVIGRISFPGSTQVTIDNLWYSDFFDIGWGFSVEGELMSYVTPQWGVGGYVSAGWDEFNGQTLHFFNGDFVSVGNMDQTNIIVGGKFQQQFSPWGVWEGRLGVGWLHYSSVKWSGLDTGVTFSDEELFRAINRAVFELGFRTIFGNRHIAGDFGFGFRYAGAAARGKDVTNAIDPDLFYTFTLELGLTVRF